MRRRPGLSLTEAIVALFVAALGIISLLVLFPLGAIQMGQALKDERTLQAALKADGLLRWYWRDQVVEPTGRPGDPFVPPVTAPNLNYPGVVRGADPFVLAFSDPNDNYPRPFPFMDLGTTPATVVPRSLPLLPVTGFQARPPVAGGGVTYPPVPAVPLPSYPVVIDPIGWQARNGRPADQAWVAGVSLAGTPNYAVHALPRRSLRLVYPQVYNAPPAPTTTMAMNWVYGAELPVARPYRLAGLLDDLTYDEAGNAGLVEPTAPVGTPPRIERLGRYNWAAVLQRPDNQVPDTATLSVMVFENRAPAYTPAGAERQYPRDSGRPLQQIAMTVGASSFDVYYDGEPPPIQKGRWVLDGTITNPPASPPPATPVLPAGGIRNANFYRVASVTPSTDNAGRTFLRVELQTPILQPLGSLPDQIAITPTDPVTGATAGAANSLLRTYAGQIYVFDGLTEVFVRPPLQAQLSSAP